MEKEDVVRRLAFGVGELDPATSGMGYVAARGVVFLLSNAGGRSWESKLCSMLSGECSTGDMDAGDIQRCS